MAMAYQGQLLEINILGCRNLRDKEWFSRQDPYVVIQYAGTKFRTKTDTDGGKNPSFNQKFVLPLIEGLREVNVEVWNSNTVQFDDFIGSGRILLEKALTAGYDDSTWNLTSRRGKYAGEVRVILHFNKMTKPAHAPAAAPLSHYNTPPPPQTYPYGPPAAVPYSPYPAASSYYPQRQPEYPPPPSPYAVQHQPPPPGPYTSQHYPPPPASGYGAPYPAPPPSSYTPPPPAPPAGYPPVYQEYPYRPY